MMVNAMNKTTECTPYKKIIIGSNEISCKYLININGFYPIIISKGDVPRIWLYVMSKGQIITLVDDSKGVFNRISVVNDDIKKEITIIFEETPGSVFVILKAIYESEGVLYIKEMDLNPIGLSIVSDEKELRIGNNHFSGNVVIGAESFISMA